MRVLVLAGMTLAAAACATAPEAPAGESYYVREGMVQSINPPMEEILALQTAAADAGGNFDAARMNEEHWSQLYLAANRLAFMSQRMVEADRYLLAHPSSATPPPPTGVDHAAIQRRIDADPDAFRALAQAQAARSGELVEAVVLRDLAAIDRLTDETQAACQTCHEAFWVPGL